MSRHALAETTRPVARPLERHGPRGVILSVTRRCNLACAYCRGPDDWYDRLGRRSAVRDLPRARWGELLTLCQQLGAAEVLLSGGEPLEYPLLADLTTVLYERGLGAAIHSNGTSPRWKRYLAFLQAHPAYRPDVVISLELFPELQATLRGAPLPTALVERLVRAGLDVELKVVLHQALLPYLGHLEEALEGWARRGVSAVRFQPVVPITRAPRPFDLTPAITPLLARLRTLKLASPSLSGLIRNSAESFETLAAYLSGSVPASAGDACDIEDRLAFVSADLQVFTCKTLWRDKRGLSCAEGFDLVCCGLQR